MIQYGNGRISDDEMKILQVICLFLPHTPPLFDHWLSSFIQIRNVKLIMVQL